MIDKVLRVRCDEPHCGATIRFQDVGLNAKAMRAYARRLGWASYNGGNRGTTADRCPEHRVRRRSLTKRSNADSLVGT